MVRAFHMCHTATNLAYLLARAGEASIILAVQGALEVRESTGTSVAPVHNEW